MIRFTCPTYARQARRNIPLTDSFNKLERKEENGTVGFLKCDKCLEKARIIARVNSMRICF
jgi:hypothetical protein